ncbi:MAG: diguanylate cyclase [Thermodesulfobacteriota bacterium]
MIFRKLGTRLVVMVAVTIMFVSTAIAMFVMRYETSIHQEELKDRGEDMVMGLAHSISEHFIHDDRWEIYKNLRDMVEHGNIVEYAVVTDLNGKIMAHSNPKEFPMGMILNDPVTINTLTARGVLFQPVGRLFYDIASPVLYNRNPEPVGIIRIGITKRYMYEEINKEMANLIMISVVFSLIGIIGSILFSRTLSNPLHQLSEAADAISKGDLDKKLTIKNKDEIGKLARAFNKMAYNIKQSRNELEILSITDHVTGLYNNRQFYKLLVSEFEKCKRYKYPIACVMFDVDYFKSINDTHGHQFGDIVLKEIGALISSELRSTDTIARYGGDEFMILLPHSGVDSAFSFADKIRKKVDGHKFSKGSLSINTSISIGISVFPEDRIIGPDDMIKNSDEALYRAKMGGRNKTCVWKDRDFSEGHIATDICGVEELKEGFSNLTMNIKKAYMESTISLIKSLDSKDGYSSKHSYNVTIYALKLANKMRLTKDEFSTIRYAAILHDIGKIGIKEEILRKKGKLTEGEFEVIKRHPMIAVDIMEEMKFWDKEISIIRHHHERYDGLGYPDKLAGENIPIGARILKIADTFDAIISERSYKNPKSVDEAVIELKAYSGTQFDPALVELFLEMVRDKEI